MRRFIECLIPITACNLRCSYCYVIQEDRRNTTVADFADYTPEYIGKALNINRLGGGESDIHMWRRRNYAGKAVTADSEGAFKAGSFYKHHDQWNLDG